MEIEYTTLVHTAESTNKAEVTYYARLVWKKDLDKPHDAYITLMRVHLNVPKHKATKERAFRIRNSLVQGLDKWLREKLTKEFGDKWDDVLIKNWEKEGMDTGSLPVYKA